MKYSSNIQGMCNQYLLMWYSMAEWYIVLSTKNGSYFKGDGLGGYYQKIQVNKFFLRLESFWTNNLHSTKVNMLNLASNFT